MLFVPEDIFRNLAAAHQIISGRKEKTEADRIFSDKNHGNDKRTIQLYGN